jgi:DNA-binding transcriptional LysR family regulator
MGCAQPLEFSSCRKRLNWQTNHEESTWLSMEHLDKLLLLRDVVDLGSFSAAARLRGLDPSTVSKHIKTLEMALAVEVLRRSSRQLSLTPAGRLVYEHATGIGEAVDGLEARLGELRDTPVGELRVGCMAHLSGPLVQPAVAALLTRAPRTRVSVLVQDGHLAFDRRRLDVAVQVGLPEEARLVVRKVADNPVWIVASPGLLHRCPAPSTPEALADYPVVAYRSDTTVVAAWPYLHTGERRKVVVRPRCWVDDGNALLDAIKAGVGAGYVSAFSAQQAVADGRLVRLMPDVELPPYAPVYAVVAPTAFPPSRRARFIEALVARGAALAGA